MSLYPNWWLCFKRKEHLSSLHHRLERHKENNHHPKKHNRATCGTHTMYPPQVFHKHEQIPCNRAEQQQNHQSSQLGRVAKQQRAPFLSTNNPKLLVPTSKERSRYQAKAPHHQSYNQPPKAKARLLTTKLYQPRIPGFWTQPANKSVSPLLVVKPINTSPDIMKFFKAMSCDTYKILLLLNKYIYFFVWC